MVDLYDIFIKSIILLPFASITYIGFGMARDYLEVSYSEKNKKEN